MLCGPEFKIMGLYNRFCERFFAAVIIRLTAQSDSWAHLLEGEELLQSSPIPSSIGEVDT